MILWSACVIAFGASVKSECHAVLFFAARFLCLGFVAVVMSPPWPARTILETADACSEFLKGAIVVLETLYIIAILIILRKNLRTLFEQLSMMLFFKHVRQVLGPKHIKC